MDESSIEEDDGSGDSPNKMSSSPMKDLAVEDLNISDVFPMPRRSRRTSRLTCGRKTLGGNNNKTESNNELNRAIPRDLPEHERLELLLENCFDVCISDAAGNVLLATEGDDPPPLKRYVGSVTDNRDRYCEKIKSYLKKSNICKLVVTDHEKWREDAAFSAYFSAMDNLKSESEKWDEVFLQIRKQLQSALKKPVHASEDKSEATKELDGEMAAYDYTETLQEMDGMAEEFLIHLDHFAVVLKLLRYCENMCRREYEHRSDCIRKRFNHEVSETPRTLLTKMTNLLNSDSA